MEQQPYSPPEYQPPPPPHSDRQPHHGSHVPRHAMPHFEHAGNHRSEAAHTPPTAPTEIIPRPVVHVLSPGGIEYVFLTITLFTGAFGLGWTLVAMINNQFRFEVLAFPLACLLVAAPVFSWIFLHLKQAELANPTLRLDASKRRVSQFAQVIAFIIALFTLVGFITALLAKVAGKYSGEMAPLILSAMVIFFIAGGILAYYWHDEHRP